MIVLSALSIPKDYIDYQINTLTEHCHSWQLGLSRSEMDSFLETLDDKLGVFQQKSAHPDCQLDPLLHLGGDFDDF